jgi:hypothetical protein
MTSYYAPGRGGQPDKWSDLTDLYNVTYKTIHKEDGFNKVLYNEALNVLVSYPKEDARGFEKASGSPVVTMGLKTARGYAKDYRFLDGSIPGAGKYVVDEEVADNLIDDPYTVIENLQPEYTKNFGKVPMTDLTESQRSTLRSMIREEARWYMQEKEEEEEMEMAEVENAESGNHYRVSKEFAMSNPQKYSRIKRIVKETLEEMGVKRQKSLTESKFRKAIRREARKILREKR